uniref:Kinesin light chain n=1 Tax=Odontella aurita TaxID=265563 RepID=A0A7S4I7W5_9STRA
MGDASTSAASTAASTTTPGQSNARARRELREEERELAIVHHNLGNVHLKRSEMGRAVDHYRKALAVRRRHCGCEDGGFADLVVASASVAAQEAGGATTTPLIPSGGAKSASSTPPSTSPAPAPAPERPGEEELEGMADTLHSMGCAYEATGRHNLALGCFNEALVIKRSVSRDRYAPISGNGNAAAPGAAGGANAAAEGAMVPFGAGQGGGPHGGPQGGDPDAFLTLSYANTLVRIGSIHSKLSDHDVALSHYESALRVQRRHLGRDHVAVARTLSDMGRILRRRSVAVDVNLVGADQAANAGTSEAIAMKCYNEALRITKLQFGPNHATVAGVMYEMGCVYDRRGDYDRAIGCYRHSLRVYGRRYARNLFRQLMGYGVADHLASRGGADGFGADPAAEAAAAGVAAAAGGGNGGGGGTEEGMAVVSGGTSSASSTLLSNHDGTALDREQYAQVSRALQDAVRKSYGDRLGDSAILGVLDAESCSSVDTCWMSLEMLLFRLMELLGVHLVEPARRSVNAGLRTAVSKIDSAGAQAIITTRDTMAYQFLYLVHE